MKQLSFLILLFTFSLSTLDCSSAIKAGRIPASTEQDEAMRAKLGEKWLKLMDSPSTPQFLKERSYEEAIYAGQPVPAKIAEAILASDNEQVQGNISDILPNDHAYHGLIHQMKRKYLVATLQAKEMIPRAAQYGNNSESQSYAGVYLELKPLKGYKPFSFEGRDVELTFTYKVLDRDDYYINSGWSYGAFDIYTAAPLLNRGRIKYYLLHYLYELPGNEFVFTKPVSIEFLSSILVPKGEKMKLIAELKQKKVPLPSWWKNWEDHIKETP